MMRTILLVLALLARPAAAEMQVTRLAPATAIPLLGHMLTDREGQEIGRLVDILAAPDGTPRAAIADIGGFMGVGVRRIAIAWSLLGFRKLADGWEIRVNAAGSAVAAAPEYPGGAEGIPVLSTAP